MDARRAGGHCYRDRSSCRICDAVCEWIQSSRGQAKRGDSGEVRDSGEARRRRSEGSEGSEDEEGEANESGREETSAHRSWRGMQVTIWVRSSLSSRTRSLSSTASLRACTRNSTGESSTSSSRYAQARIVGFVWSAQMIGSVLRSCTGAWDGDHLGTCR